MQRIIVEKLTAADLKDLGIDRWSPWSCEKSVFDWTYDENETCYFHEGHVRVKTAEGTVEIVKGDLVTFPKGLKCSWEVLEPVRKVYALKLVRKEVRA